MCPSCTLRRMQLVECVEIFLSWRALVVFTKKKKQASWGQRSAAEDRGGVGRFLSFSPRLSLGKRLTARQKCVARSLHLFLSLTISRWTLRSSLPNKLLPQNKKATPEKERRKCAQTANRNQRRRQRKKELCCELLWWLRFLCCCRIRSVTLCHLQTFVWTHFSRRGDFVAWLSTGEAKLNLNGQLQHAFLLYGITSLPSIIRQKKSPNQLVQFCCFTSEELVQ